MPKDKEEAIKKNDLTGMTNNFSAPEWVHTTNIYEVNIRQYTAEGTFNAFLRELPRLKDMGVKTLWLMPITPIAQKNKKGTLGSYYACSDYTAINPEFGTVADFKNLVRQAHTLGFKLIIDWVANHTGWDHRWTKEHPDFYLKDSSSGTFKIASGMDDIIELDYKNPAMVDSMISAMKFWVKECDIDGFRCDLAAWVELPFWKKARLEVDAVKPIFWLGEFDELENPDYGKVFDASYTWTWMHKTEEFYKEHLSITTLDTLLEKYNEIGDSSMRTWFTSNHDENSWNGTEYEKYGNMARALAVFTCTWNGIPMLYSGQEIPMKTKRLAFFEKDPIPWGDKYELHEFYKSLLNLRSLNPALRGGDPSVTTYRIQTTDDEKAFVYLRKNGDREVLVILNLSYSPNLKFDLLDERITGVFKDLFSGFQRDFTNERTIGLKEPWEFMVFVK